MEGMTELINGTFIEDLSAVLSSCAEGKKRKTFFEIDKEFERMMVVVKSKFVRGLFPSVYEDVIMRKLAHVKSLIKKRG
jgi:hypothetical protein